LILAVNRRSFGGLGAMSDAGLSGHVLAWGIDTPSTNGEACNIGNGQPMRWLDMWPQIAAYFEMDWELQKPKLVKKWFEANSYLWDELCETYGLKPFELKQLFSSDFFDKSFLVDWDVVYAMEKAQQYGFDAQIDNFEMFRFYFDWMKAEKIIPDSLSSL